MCSTFKWVLGAFVLEDLDAGRINFESKVAIAATDLVPYAPVVEKHIGAVMTIEALVEAAVGLSDNAAANIILQRVGGPEGFTRRLRGAGDAVTRLDRWEIDLNENKPGDPRDTTTPLAMTGLLERFLATNTLSMRSRKLLVNWMVASPTGRDRLRAGFPVDWVVGDKTGTSVNGAVNDVAFVMPPGRPPYFVAAYLNAPDLSTADANRVHRLVGARVAEEFA